MWPRLLAAALLFVARPLAARNASIDPALYVGVVYPRGETGLARSVERSLGGGPLRPILTEIESGLGAVCAAWAGKKVAALLLFGPAPSIAIASASLQLPTLWIGGHQYLQEELGDSVVRVGPGVPQGLRALRSLLISWRWYSYTLLWGGPPLAGLSHLSRPPLSPLVYRLSPPYTKILNSVSHSRRGVIALVGDRKTARAVLTEATELGMTDGKYVWVWLDTAGTGRLDTSQLRRPRSSLLRYNDRLPVGLLRLRAGLPPADRHLVRAAARLLLEAIRRTSLRTEVAARPISCWGPSPATNFSLHLARELKRSGEEALSGRAGNESAGRALAARFQILNLVPRPELHNSTQQLSASQPETVVFSDNWKQVGEVIGCCDVRLERIIWPGGNVGGPCGGSRTVLKVVTAIAAPFVMVSESARGVEGACLRGLPCDIINDNGGVRYTVKVSCCYGLAMDLLEAVSQELEFDFYLYMVPDAMFGTKKVNPDDKSEFKWTGVVSELLNGNAHMAFTALSITRPRSEVIDFSVPYYFSGVSFLSAPSQRTDIPLLAFLLPFSPELWVAIFTSLNVTAVAVAIYEWLSPFGLNPWGRQRTKNFSMSSALWVCWGLLCGHLVAFKAPKSWPNKFLINVWGGFSVIFVASYTANIAALIAGLFFHSATATPNDNSWLSQRVAAPEGSSAEYYVQRANKMLWEHMRRTKVPDVAVGVQMLKNGTLDILIADTPILDYYRATDQGCKLQRMGDSINDDMYGIGMVKGFPLKDSISSIVSKFTSNGYMDLLQEKWYGGLACFTADNDMSQPKPLGVSAVAGVFLLLGLGVVMGFVILIVEHLFYKYTLPILRHKPKGTIWRSRNIMFFSQKLYRFINCVELVSPHHAARELVHTIRQGQITSLFQKSVKRKEHEQRRRRKSKAQFFEMIQEIRRVQQEEKQNNVMTSESSSKQSPRSRGRSRSPQLLSPPDQGRRMSKLPSSYTRSCDGVHSSTHLSLSTEQIAGMRRMKSEYTLELARRFSKDVFRSKSSGNLSLRRMSSDINFAASRFLECHSSQAIGRRLSRDTNPSPPDINSRRQSHLLTPELSVASAAELEAPATLPRSPYLLPPEIAVHPPSTQHRFSYIDAGNPVFRERLARFTGERCQSEEMEERRKNAPSLLEQITNMQDQFPNKPKVVSVLPKNKSASEMTLRQELAQAVERISRDELGGFSQYPGAELKRRVIDSYNDKDPT